MRLYGFKPASKETTSEQFENIIGHLYVSDDEEKYAIVQK